MTSTTICNSPPGKGLSRRDCAALAVLGLASPLVALAALPGAGTQAAGTPFAIVFPPWVTAEDAAIRTLSAGHLVLRAGRSASIVIAASASGQERSAARPQGAILLVALTGLAGCLDAVATPAAS